MKENRMNRSQNVGSRGGGDAVYALGTIGSLVYYVQQAHGIWLITLAVLKAVVWPAFVVYDLLKFIH
jgi:hypothetical protein